MARAAGVLIVRAGRALLAPRGEVLGWIGGACRPGESPADCARREAREEIGCEVEILHAPATFLPDLRRVALPPPAPLLRTADTELFLARLLGAPRAVEVPALVWLPVERLPEAALGETMSLAARVVARFGAQALAGEAA